MIRSAKPLLSLFALSSLAASMLSPSASSQTVSLLQSAPQGALITISVSSPRQNETLMLVGYVSVMQDPPSGTTYSLQQSWVGAQPLLETHATYQDYKNLFGFSGSNPLVGSLTTTSPDTADFGIPKEIVEQVLQNFWDTVQDEDFETAIQNLTENPGTANPYFWAGTASHPVVPWSQIYQGSAGTFDNEELVRHLIANQLTVYSQTGQTISPYSSQVGELVFQIGNEDLACELTMLAISIKSTPGAGGKPDIHIEPNGGILLHLPGNIGGMRVARLSQGYGLPWLYFGATGTLFRFELANSVTSMELGPIEICFPGASPVAATLTGTIAEAIVPVGAVDGQISVREIATQLELAVARENEGSPGYWADFHNSSL